MEASKIIALALGLLTAAACAGQTESRTAQTTPTGAGGTSGVGGTSGSGGSPIVVLPSASSSTPAVWNVCKWSPKCAGCMLKHAATEKGKQFQAGFCWSGCGYCEQYLCGCDIPGQPGCEGKVCGAACEQEIIDFPPLTNNHIALACSMCSDMCEQDCAAERVGADCAFYQKKAKGKQ